MLFNMYEIPSIRNIENAWNKVIAPKFAELGFKFEKDWITVKIQHTSISALAITLTKRVRYSKAVMKELVTIITRETRYIEEEFDYISSKAKTVKERDILNFINRLGYLYTVIGTKDSLELKKKLSQADKLLKPAKKKIVSKTGKAIMAEEFDDEF